MKSQYILIAAGAATLMMSSCGTQSPSGFLENYEQLTPGNNKYGAKMAYSNPNMDFLKYDRHPLTTETNSKS